MVTICHGRNEEVLTWLSRKVNVALPPQTELIWGRSQNGTIAGAMGFGGRMGRTWGSISIAIADPRAALPIIRAGARFLFGEMRARAGYVTIGGNRGKWILELEKTVGFREVDRIYRGLSLTEDLVVLRVTPESCRVWQRELKKLRHRALEVA